MVARRTRQNFPQRSRRQPTTWSRLISIAAITIPTVSKILLGTINLGNPGISETVRRTRGVVSVASDQGAAFEDQSGAFGMIVVSDLAIAAGIVSIPSPVANGNDDGWFVWQPFVQGGAAGSSGHTSVEWEFDSKGMRRVQEGFTVAIVAENNHPTFQLELSFAVSVLTSLS